MEDLSSGELYVSVDLDSVRHHLRGYGIVGATSGASPVMTRSLPRYLELFARLGIRGTFFVVAEDAAAGAVELREAVRRGHEVASHSLTHPLPFASLTAAAVEDEVTRSRSALEDLLGIRVSGFRAPGCSVNAAVLAQVGRAGYAYDSSELPSPYLPASVVRLRGYSHSGRPIGLAAALRVAFAPRAPRRLPGGPMELPISVTRVWRVPLLHTLNLLLGEPVFDRATRSFEQGTGYAHYVLHGVDLLRAEEIDAPLRPHPGARLSLAEKTDRVESALRRLARRRTTRRLDEFPGLSVAAAAA